MSVKFIQIGVTALRDPLTGEPLEAVPLYIRAEDAPSQARADIRTGPLAKTFSDAVRDYVSATAGLPD